MSDCVCVCRSFVLEENEFNPFGTEFIEVAKLFRGKVNNR